MQSPRPTVRKLRTTIGSAEWIASLACAAACLWNAAAANGAETRLWTASPYRMIVTLAFEDDVRPQAGLEAELARSIVDRVDATLRPLWTMELEVARDAESRRKCFDLRETPWDELSAKQRGVDKLLWLGVRATIDGYELSCREFDVYLRRWGPIKNRTVSQASYLPEACVELLKSAFSPLAIIEPIEGNDEQVQLLFKGNDLPRITDDEPFITSGDAYLPLSRRTDRNGKLLENGVSPTPWTFLTIADSNDAGWLGAVHSGTRRPFAARRRGTVEQVAVGLRNRPGPTPVRFHSRTDKAQGLAGYEVYRSGENGKLERLGVTDRDGTIVIPPGQEHVSMLLLRSDGQLLAKVPVPSGFPDVLQTPIADNVTRLQAQSEAQVVREELIDLVARRAIMMARAKAMLKDGRVDDAKELVMQLDALPSPSVFSRTIDNASRRIPPTDDPSVQKRIEALFSSTRDMLAKFLSTRPLTDLQNEVNAASAPAGS